MILSVSASEKRPLPLVLCLFACRIEEIHCLRKKQHPRLNVSGSRAANGVASKRELERKLPPPSAEINVRPSPGRSFGEPQGAGRSITLMPTGTFRPARSPLNQTGLARAAVFSRTFG